MFDEKEFIKIMNQPALRRQAFSSLVEAYQERVYWKVRKIVIDHEDANDVTQDVFIKIWQNLDKFRADSKLYTWIYRIAVNESLTFIQKKRKKNQISLEDNQLLVNSFDKGVKSGYIDGEEIELKLQKAILQLPDKQRLVFDMRYFDKLSYEDISEITGTTVGGLKATYHVAMKKVEQSLKED
jgi:RNA polymerase sigma-70 factor (ECF subfamily)